MSGIWSQDSANRTSLNGIDATDVSASAAVIGTAELATNSITSEKLANTEITSGKLVGTAKMVLQFSSATPGSLSTHYHSVGSIPNMVSVFFTSAFTGGYAIQNIKANTFSMVCTGASKGFHPFVLV